VLLVEDSREGNDEQQGKKQDQGVKIRAIGFHGSPFIPAGFQADDNRDGE